MFVKILLTFSLKYMVGLEIACPKWNSGATQISRSQVQSNFQMYYDFRLQNWIGLLQKLCQEKSDQTHSIQGYKLARIGHGLPLEAIVDIHHRMETLFFLSTVLCPFQAWNYLPTSCCELFFFCFADCSYHNFLGSFSMKENYITIEYTV